MTDVTHLPASGVLDATLAPPPDGVTGTTASGAAADLAAAVRAPEVAGFAGAVPGADAVVPATDLPGPGATVGPPPGTPGDADGARWSRRSGPWWLLLRNPGLVLAVLIVVLVLAWAVVPGVFVTHDPFLAVTADRLQAPGVAHWFGTDDLGRDLYSRVVHAAALSLQATAVAVLIGLVVGSLIGLVGGTVGGLLDDVLMRVVDVLMAVPGLLLALAIVTVLGFGTTNVAIAVGISAVASFARVMRSQVIAVAGSAYVEAAHGSGLRRASVVGRHVLPNSLGPVLVLAALEFGSAILAVSALSFLGFGAEPPAPEWGSLVSDGRNYLATSWWLTTLPGLVVAVVVLAANRISRALGGEVRR